MAKRVDSTVLERLVYWIKRITARRTAAIPFGQVDSTSTSTVYTATVDGITELYDGVCMWLKNGVVTSAAGFTLNINNLGAKPVYGSLAAATASTTIFNVNYTMLFVYNSTRVSGGCWDCVYGYNSDTNTIAYNVRSNAAAGTMASALYRYQFVFTKSDGGTLLPANGTSNSTGTSKTLTTEAFDPFAPIYYYSTTTTVAAGSSPSATYMYLQHSSADTRYAFNAGSTLVSGRAVYIKCSPQADGTVKLAGNTCLTQTLPTTADGYVYLSLGKAYSTYQIWLSQEHPIYCYRNGGLQLWTGVQSEIDALSSGVSSLLSLISTVTSNLTLCTLSNPSSAALNVQP